MPKKKSKQLKYNYEVEIIERRLDLYDYVQSELLLTRQQAVDFIIKHEAKGAHCKLFRLSNSVALEYESPK